MFHSHLQYSLPNWGRATKTSLHRLDILQNNIFKACFFYPQHFQVTPLYSNFKVLKLQDIFKMKIAFKFNH